MIYLTASNSNIPKLYADGFNVGWLLGPGDRRVKVELPYAIDNGRYHPYGEEPRYSEWDVYEVCQMAILRKWGEPLFVVAPDVPYKGSESLEMSYRHLKAMSESYPGWRVAVAVQDGMKFTDKIGQFQTIFVAGSTKWKLETLPYWADAAREACMNLHLARVNSVKRIWLAKIYGADSADGTGLARFHDRMKRTLLGEIQQKMFPSMCKPAGGMWG